MSSARDEQDDVLGRAFDRRLARRLWTAARRHHGLVAMALGLFPLIAAAELAQPYLLKVAIDDHILTADWAGLAVTAGLYALTLAALYGLRMVEAYLMAVAGQRVTHDLRAALFEHLLRLEAAFFDRNPVGRLMTRVLNGFLQESLQGMTVIQLFARERQELGAFRRLNRDYRRALFGSTVFEACLLYTSPSPRDGLLSRMPSSA